MIIHIIIHILNLYIKSPYICRVIGSSASGGR